MQCLSIFPNDFFRHMRCGLAIYISSIVKSLSLAGLLCVCLLVSAAGDAAPLPAIGDSPIKTQAEAFFYVGDSPVAIRRLSNIVSVDILPVRVLTFSSAKSVKVVPGERYAVPVTLFNDGNVPVRYKFDLTSAQLPVPTVLLDVNANGRHDDGDAALALPSHRRLSYGGHDALLLTGMLPRGIKEGTAIDIALTASVPGFETEAHTGIRLVADSTPQPGLTLEATPYRLDKDDRTRVAVSVFNHAERALSGSRNIVIDGLTRAVTLVRYRIPEGLHYVRSDGDADVTGGDAAPVLLLFADRADLGGAKGTGNPARRYRSTMPAADVAEIAWAFPRPLQARERHKFFFSMQLGDNVGKRQIVSHAEVLNDAIAPPGRSNLLVFDIASALSPDLAMRMMQTDTASADSTTHLQINIDNEGNAPTQGVITVRGRAPGRLNASDIDATGWRCETTPDSDTTGDSAFACSYLACRDAVYGSSSMPPIFMRVANPHAAPETENCRDGKIVSAVVDVANEAHHLLFNNRREMPLICRGGAVIRGRAWIDADNSGIYGSGAETLPGWQVQLLRDGNVAYQTVTDTFGKYTLAGILPGGGYSLRFLSPQGRVEAPPLAGSNKNGVLQIASRRDFANGVLVYTAPLESQAYRDQDLALLPTGVVFNMADGRPLAGAGVVIFGPPGFVPLKHLVGPAGNIRTVTDTDGRYNFFLTPDAPAGRYGWRVTVPGFETGDIDDSEGGQDLLVLTDRLRPTAADQVREAYKVFQTPYVPEIGAGEGNAPMRRQLRRPGAMPGPTSPMSPAATSAMERNADAAQRENGYFSIRRVTGAKKVVNNHLGLFPVLAGDALFLEKTSDRKVVETIDMFHYRIKLGHRHAATRRGFTIDDRLPRGLRYVPGTLRRLMDGGSTVLADPLVVQDERRQGESATLLRFDFSDLLLPAAQPFEISYRVAVGANAVEGARLTSTAVASAGGETAQASAVVRVTGGVFSNDAFVLGKVFLDCATGLMPDDREAGPAAGSHAGVPGVRIYMEDGSFAETDRNGNYSLYGLKPQTHVLKMDTSSLPVSAQARLLSSRNAGNGGSLFLDVRNGELGRGDFSLSCNAAILEEVAYRRANMADAPDELDSALKLHFDSDAGGAGAGDNDAQRAPLRGDRASGLIDDRTGTPSAAIAPATGPVAAAATTVTAEKRDGTMAAADRELRMLQHAQQPPQPPQPPQPTRQHRTSSPSFETLLHGDTTLGIVNLRPGQIMRGEVTDITVIGASAPGFILQVNGKNVSERHVGKRSTLESRRASAWEYIAVRLHAGRNTISVTQGDGPDDPLARHASVDVVVPGPPAAIHVTMPPRLQADGKSVVALNIALRDMDDIPVSAPVLLTLRGAPGAWITPDVNPDEDGLQLLVRQGIATVLLQSPSQPGETLLSVEQGLLRETVRLQFEPALRPMIAVGVIEGMVTLNNGRIEMAGGAGNNGFERELRTFSHTSADGGRQIAGRTAFFLKGRVKGEYLLTAAFDSDGDRRDRLFRDIEPDKYYPIYGDDSVRGFDAQASSKLYLRVDRGRSYLLYGDFNTGDNDDMRQLTSYSRAVNGLRYRFENERFISNVFASRSNLRQQVIAFPAANTRFYPGVMPLSYVTGSERVELVFYHRGRPAAGRHAKVLTRHADYTIDELSGSLTVTEAQTARDPLTGADNYYRIVFESDDNEEQSWLYGGDGTLLPGKGIRLGVTAVNDANPNRPRRLGGIFGSWRPDSRTEINAEYGMTSVGLDLTRDAAPTRSGTGSGWRIGGKHHGERLQSELSVSSTTTGFNNLSASIGGGRREARLKSIYTLDHRTRIKSELLHTRETADTGRDGIPDAARDIGAGFDRIDGNMLSGSMADDNDGRGDSLDYDGLLFGIERDLDHTMKLEGGMRVVRGLPDGANGSGADAEPLDLVTLRTRLGSGIPMLPAAGVYTEYEQDVRDSHKRALTFGADYALSGSGRLYARHEAISSLGSAYEIEENTRSYRTLAGIEGDYMEGGRAFSEYRGARPFAERGAEMAYGTRNSWQPTDRLSLRTSIERTRTVAGDRDGESDSVHNGRIAGSAIDLGKHGDEEGAGTRRRTSSSQSEATTFSTVLAYRYSRRLKGNTGLDVRYSDTEHSYLYTVGIGYRLDDKWSVLAKNALYMVRARGNDGRDGSAGRRIGRDTVRARQRIGLAYRGVSDHRLNGLAYYEHRSARGGDSGIDAENSHIVSVHVNLQPRPCWTVAGRYAVKYKTMRGDNGNSALSGHLGSLRVLRDIGARWDAGIGASLFADSMGQRRHAYGLEVGHRIIKDLWISGGYNIVGFVDRDFRGMAETARGMYIRMRYKFDENSF